MSLLCPFEPVRFSPHPVESDVGAYSTDSARPPEVCSVALAEARLGDWIGGYKVLQKIGEGGCAVIYMAEQREPVRRCVALKIVKLGMDTREIVARFDVERQALALMDHPGIARVFDAGATPSGRPFFAMELIRGVPITRFCDEQKLSPKARLELFIRVCHAVHHAHQKGIIHRDLKPANILVTLHDGGPVPKIIDFGIAKAVEARLTNTTLCTAFDRVMGTPLYMSPEQAGCSGLPIDARSDVYSLGVLLYELLTGRPPTDLPDGGDGAHVRRVLQEDELPPPSVRFATLSAAERVMTAEHRSLAAPQLALVLRSDLESVIMRCLERDRTRRYESALELANDLQRHLQHRPVLAQPPRRAYRLRKFVRRNRLACIVGVLGALLAASLLWSTHLMLSQARLLERARAAEERSEAAWRVAEGEQRSHPLLERVVRNVASPPAGRVAPSVDGPPAPTPRAETVPIIRETQNAGVTTGGRSATSGA